MESQENATPISNNPAFEEKVKEMLKDVPRTLVEYLNKVPVESAKTGDELPAMDCIPYHSLERIGGIFSEGVRQGYKRNNWRNGANNYHYQLQRARHAARHLFLWLNGDRKEDHLAKVAWFCVTQMELERIEAERESLKTYPMAP